MDVSGVDVSGADGVGNALLPEANRAGGIDAPWAGDDQQWWDWYVTLAANPEAAGPLVDGPGLPDVPAADDDEVARYLDEPYAGARRPPARASARDAFVKLPGVLSAPVVKALAVAAAGVADRCPRHRHGRPLPGPGADVARRRTDAGRSALTPPRRDRGRPARRRARCGIYHDNALSKEPGCGRTPWHHDDEHFPLDSHQVLTAWMPMSAIPAEMGPLSFAHGTQLRELLAGLEFDKVGTSYDVAVSQRFGQSGVTVTDSPYAVGEVSFHSSLCFHTAGPNRTTQPRRALATTYFADGVRVVAAPTMVSGTWREFLPDTEPGAVAASALNPVVGRRGPRG